MLLLWVAVLVLPLSAVGAERDEQIRQFAQRVRELQKKGVLPIIDVEFHYGGKIEIERLIKRMNENGVALTWLGPNERLGSQESLRLNESFPNRFVPTTVHGDGPLWHNGDRDFLEKLAGDVRSGRYFAMGEFEARHYPSNTNTRDVHLPVDSLPMQVVWSLSQETGIPFLLHHEAEDTLLPELERMLTKYPQSKVIWCHGGRNRNPNTWKRFSEAGAVREFLTKYPNLYFDLVQSKPGSQYPPTGYIEGIMYDPINWNYLRKDWKKVFEEFPDRLVIGSDINTGRFNQYDRVMDTFRSVVFKRLSPHVAERLAFKNAWKLMTGKEWEEGNKFLSASIRKYDHVSSCCELK